MTERESFVHDLKKRRPRDRFLRISVLLIGCLVAIAWLTGGFRLADMVSPRRIINVRRFIREAQPYPLREPTTAKDGILQWAGGMMADRGWEATVQTLSISVASIVLAGIAAWVLLLPAARNIASPEPFLPSGRVPGWWTRVTWKSLVAVTRAFLIFVRAIPEYVWAFLFLAMLGPKAWPAVLALALHNTGILGKLGSEVVENVEPAVPKALRGLGSLRTQIAVLGMFPVVFTRFLLFFCYRWETCVREATVLGLLGFASLGYWIADARARDRYDEMLFFILLGAVLVLLGDVVSALTRRFLRHVT